MNTYLSIDIGTSATKLSLFDEQGRLIAARSAAYGVEYPRPEWAEQDPAVWWSAVCRLGPEMARLAGADRPRGISISGQTPVCVPVDAAGRPLRPAILWLDRRSTAQVTWLREKIGEERCRRVSANRLDSYFGGLKWLWFKQEEGELFSRTWKILQANGYIILKMTGQAVIDPAQAGLCSPCFNFDRREWDEGICSEMGIPISMLPEVFRPEAVIGQVTAEAARESGLPAGTPVVCGGADFACACLGAGVTGQGAARGALMLGTAGNLLFPGVKNRSADSLPDSRLLHTIHLSGEALPFGGVMAGGNLSWFAGLLGNNEPGLFSRLDQEAEQVPPGSEGLVFLPYLMGERTPIWDPGARGAFVGLSSRHGRAHLYRAILEGVAFAFRQIAEIVEGGGAGGAAGNTTLQSITAIDGGARSALWRQILADILNRPIQQGSERAGGTAGGALAGPERAGGTAGGALTGPERAGGTALGSAFLAALGTGGVKAYEDIAGWAAVASTTWPDLLARQRYDRLYPVYQGLYPKLKPDFDVLGRI